MKIYLTRRTPQSNHWYYLTDIDHPTSVQPISFGESIEANNDEIRLDDKGIYIVREVSSKNSLNNKVIIK
jgi:hypothetical protein